MQRGGVADGGCPPFSRAARCIYLVLRTDTLRSSPRPTRKRGKRHYKAPFQLNRIIFLPMRNFRRSRLGCAFCFSSARRNHLLRISTTTLIQFSTTVALLGEQCFVLSPTRLFTVAFLCGSTVTVPFRCGLLHTRLLLIATTNSVFLSTALTCYSLLDSLSLLPLSLSLLVSSAAISRSFSPPVYSLLLTVCLPFSTIYSWPLTLLLHSGPLMLPLAAAAFLATLLVALLGSLVAAKSSCGLPPLDLPLSWQPASSALLYLPPFLAAPSPGRLRETEINAFIFKPSHAYAPRHPRHRKMSYIALQRPPLLHIPTLYHALSLFSAAAAAYSSLAGSV